MASSLPVCAPFARSKSRSIRFSTTVQNVAIIGCGVIGAAIAYELSLLPNLTIHLFDQGQPAHASSGAALGVLVGIISQKVKGRNWRLREQSITRYPGLIAELEAKTGQPIQHNSQGLLNLCFDAAELPRWQSLQQIRQTQGYALEIWSPERVGAACPHLNLEALVAGIYSPQDLQVNPTELTRALVAAAQINGVKTYFDQAVLGFDIDESAGPTRRRCTGVSTVNQTFTADFVVLASGLGTSALTQILNQVTPIGPVLGQALHLQPRSVLGNPDFQPAINGNDIHLVPLGDGSYWVGATVEFPPDTSPAELLALQPQAERLQAVWQGAISYCPALADAQIEHQWFGLRPRPSGQAAPVIKPVTDFTNVWLATGHYRNGILLAPATALQIRQVVETWLQPGQGGAEGGSESDRRNELMPDLAQQRHSDR